MIDITIAADLRVNICRYGSRYLTRRGSRQSGRTWSASCWGRKQPFKTAGADIQRIGVSCPMGRL